MNQVDRPHRTKERLQNDPLEWLDDAPTPVAPAETAPLPRPLKGVEAEAAYEMLSTSVVVTDADLVIRYANSAAVKMFTDAEHEVQKDLPHFSVGSLIGQNIDVFHKNPSYQRAILARMTSPHDASLKAGEVSMGFRVNRVMTEGDVLSGYMVELWDVTYERATKAQVSNLMGGLTQVANAQVAGDTAHLLNLDNLSGEFKELAQKVNDMLTFRNATSQQVLDWLNTFASGDMQHRAPVFPGKMKAVTAAIEDARKVALREAHEAIENRAAMDLLLGEMAAMSDAHSDGDIGVFVASDKFGGSFRIVAEKVNEMVAAHIDTKRSAIKLIKEFSEGKFSTPFPALPGKKAFVSDAIEAMRTSFKTLLSEINRVSSSIRDGNLDVTPNASQFSGDFRTIMTDFASVLETMNGVMETFGSQVQQAADAVEQLSRSSKELASNSQIQSASVDEVSASAEETDTQVKANAASAGQANQLVTGAAAVADQGKKKIGQMVQAMEGIRASSQDIAKIIKVIDEIAFQTNLLALNAAVEAARAGQHGRGFAVVAQEVRNLAGRSAKAARETSDLIESAGARVQAGVKIADETSHAFTSIADDIDKVRTFMREITVASDEQARGVAQINTAMGEVAKIAVATSHQAEEVASSANDIVQATDRMRAEVSRFRLRARRTGPAGAEIPNLEGLPPDVMAQLEALLNGQTSGGRMSTKPRMN